MVQNKESKFTYKEHLESMIFELCVQINNQPENSDTYKALVRVLKDLEEYELYALVGKNLGCKAILDRIFNRVGMDDNYCREFLIKMVSDPNYKKKSFKKLSQDIGIASETLRNFDKSKKSTPLTQTKIVNFIKKLRTSNV